MKDKETFGSFIKEKRIEKGYSQKDLAEILFVTESAVSKWERGVTYPDITLITNICKALDITEHELIESSNDQEYHMIEKDARNFNKIKKTIFWCLNVSYAIALLACFIVNIAVNHKLSWFFIVLTSIMTAYSFCPTITYLFKCHKKIIFIASTFISLFLLFLTCSIYTSNYWFLIPTFGLLLGYFLLFYPILFFSQKKHLDKAKFNTLKRFFLITYIFGIIFILILLLLSIYWYISYNIGFAILLVVVLSIIPIIYGLMSLFEAKKVIIKIFSYSLVGVITIILTVGLISSIRLVNTKTINNYQVSDSFDDIEIIGADVDINIYPLTTEKYGSKVKCIENSKIKFDINVVDNKLIIKQSDNRNLLYLMFNFCELNIELYLDKEAYNNLFIDNNTGDIFLSQYLSFNDIKVISSTGDIEINGGIIKNNINIESSTGKVELKNVNCGKLDIKVSTGNVKLINVLVNTDLNINGSTGDLELSEFDANNIYVYLSTGDVSGTLLTSKIFMVRTSTGDISVPETTKGGICKIETSTGDINLTIK